MQDLNVVITGGTKESRDALANVIYSNLFKYGFNVSSNKNDLTNIICEKILRDHVNKTPDNLSLTVEI